MTGETIPASQLHFYARTGYVIQELDRVVLTRDIPERKLRMGDIGAAVLVHEKGASYEVEFVTVGGKTLAVVAPPADALRPVGQEIAHARRLA